MPNLTRRRRRGILIGHRGASAHAPESTKAAIEMAIEMKADMIELDVQLTADERLVVFHDERLERTTNGHGVLSRMPYHALARLDSGSWFASRFAGERILLASQALRLAGASCLVNLELKRTARPKTLIEHLGRCLRWTRSIRRVLASSFDPSLLARLRVARPRVARALLCRRHPARALGQAIELGCVAFHPHQSLVTSSLIAQAHAANLRVHVWTVDRVDEARRLVRMGADGVFTNVPDRLRRVWG